MTSISQFNYMKKTALILITILLFPLTFWAQDDFPKLKNYMIETRLWGDLDKDGIDEGIVVYLQTDGESYDRKRLLIIYKNVQDKWSKWYSSTTAILGPGEGGAKGDPFQHISIDKGILQIEQMGGSNWFWTRIDKYRFQKNDFYLIGYTSSYGNIDSESNSVDFNLSTGDIIYKKFKHNKDGETTVVAQEKLKKKGIKITLQNREVDVSIVTPKNKSVIYL